MVLGLQVRVSKPHHDPMYQFCLQQIQLLAHQSLGHPFFTSNWWVVPPKLLKIILSLYYYWRQRYSHSRPFPFLKAFFLFFFQLSDVEFPSVYCGYVLWPLVNEEVILANDLNGLAQYRRWEMQTEIYREEVDSKRCHFSCRNRKTSARTLCYWFINRLIEMS